MMILGDREEHHVPSRCTADLPEPHDVSIEGCGTLDVALEFYSVISVPNTRLSGQSEPIDLLPRNAFHRMASLDPHDVGQLLRRDEPRVECSQQAPIAVNLDRKNDCLHLLVFVAQAFAAHGSTEIGCTAGIAAGFDRNHAHRSFHQKGSSEMKRLTGIAIFLTAGLLATSVGYAAEVWRTAGFKTPESVLYDSANKRLIVSNINGGMTDADGNGFLSLVSLDGKLIAEKWTSGMDAPKGMAVSGNQLYVADITRIHVVDLATGKIAKTIPLEGAVFLNDVTANKAGDVFVTDTMANTIYRITAGKPELWLKDPLLSHPNGILADGRRLIVGTWGKGLRKDFTTEELGGLIAVDLATKKITQLPNAEKFANVDGVIKVGDDVIVSDYMAGVLYRYAPGKSVKKIATLKPGSADIATDGKTIFVPMMMEGEVVAIRLN